MTSSAYAGTVRKFGRDTYSTHVCPQNSAVTGGQTTLHPQKRQQLLPMVGFEHFGILCRHLIALTEDRVPSHRAFCMHRIFFSPHAVNLSKNLKAGQGGAGAWGHKQMHQLAIGVRLIRIHSRQYHPLADLL